MGTPVLAEPQILTFICSTDTGSCQESHRVTPSATDDKDGWRYIYHHLVPSAIFGTYQG